MKKTAATISIIFLILFSVITEASDAEMIIEYQYYTGTGIPLGSQKPHIIIRKFLKNNQDYYFTVNPETLDSGIMAGDTLSEIKAIDWPSIFNKYVNTYYIKTFKEALKNADQLQNAGITHVRPESPGLDLTVDLCPSRHPLDRNLFLQLITAFGSIESPVPVAVSVTGTWMNTHKNDLEWLIGLARENRLAITWVNHSYHHRTEKNLPLKKNFLLESGTNIDDEVLQTEVLMLENNIIPSVFFRFPGLVSDRKLVEKIIGFGLIPLGSDAWLAKNQWPEQGSIVLVHANGNEPVGINKFLDMMKKNRKNILNRQWILLDLRETMKETEELQK
jgi:hypothetical protein